MLTASFASAFGTSSATATMTVPTGTALCAPLPGAVALSGTGLQGRLGLSAGAIAFGSVCGTSSPADNKALVRTLTLSNTIDSNFATMGSYNYFYLTSANHIE